VDSCYPSILLDALRIVDFPFRDTIQRPRIYEAHCGDSTAKVDRPTLRQYAGFAHLPPMTARGI
jgi:hypothetical protein